MMFVAFVIGVVMLIVALVLLVGGLRGFSVARRILRRPTSAIAKLQEGPVEISGRVAAIGEPIISLSGQRCVAVKTTVRGQSGTGKESKLTGEKTSTRVVEARVVDATGQCRLDLGTSEILGERWVSATVFQAHLSEVPWAHQLVPNDSTHVTIEELTVPEGATVLVSGDATLPEPEAGEGGYRDVMREWVVSGSAKSLLIISVGGQLRLLARSVLPATIVVLSSLYLGALGVVIVAVAIGG